MLRVRDLAAIAVLLTGPALLLGDAPPYDRTGAVYRIPRHDELHLSDTLDDHCAAYRLWRAARHEIIAGMETRCAPFPQPVLSPTPVLTPL